MCCLGVRAHTRSEVSASRIFQPAKNSRLACDRACPTVAHHARRQFRGALLNSSFSFSSTEPPTAHSALLFSATHYSHSPGRLHCLYSRSTGAMVCSPAPELLKAPFARIFSLDSRHSHPVGLPFSHASHRHRCSHLWSRIRRSLQASTSILKLPARPSEDRPEWCLRPRQSQQWYDPG